MDRQNSYKVSNYFLKLR